MTKQLCSLIFFLSVSGFSQTTMSLEDCENLFQKNNLLLLAEQYNIESARAAVIQARVWEQPYLEADFNFYNPENHNYFDVGNQGQKQFGIQQLIYLGGKKRNEINLAKNDVQLAELQYEQLLRNLVLETRRNFYELFFDLIKINSIENQLSNLESLIGSYQLQTDKGNVALKDLVRLQSLAISIKSDLISLNKNILEKQENLKILTNTSVMIVPNADPNDIRQKLSKSLDYFETQLQEIALSKNPEYLSSIKLIENNELRLKWQKSLSVPDVTLGANYDQRSGAFENQKNISIGIPLPLWNKNKGAIKMAKAELSQSKTLKELKELELKAKVTTAVQNFLFQQTHYKKRELDINNLETVNKGMLANFQKKNISLIEFTDFMESYNQSTIFNNEIKKELMISGETLNYLTNEKVF